MRQTEEVSFYHELEYVFNQHQVAGHKTDHLVQLMLEALGYAEEEKQPSEMDAQPP